MIIELVKEGYKKLDDYDTTQIDADPKKFLEEVCGLNVEKHGFSSVDPRNKILLLNIIST